MDRACSTNGEKRNAYGILVGKPEGKRPIGRPRGRWVENIIKMYLREIGWDGMDWIDLAHDRDQWRVLVNTEMNLRVTRSYPQQNLELRSNLLFIQCIMLC
jgi:hypothetical protein